MLPHKQGSQENMLVGETDRERTGWKPFWLASRCHLGLFIKAIHFWSSTPGSHYYSFWVVDLEASISACSTTLLNILQDGGSGGGGAFKFIPQQSKKRQALPVPFWGLTCNVRRLSVWFSQGLRTMSDRECLDGPWVQAHPYTQDNCFPDVENQQRC